MTKIIKKSLEVGGRTLTFEVGRFAEQATSAVMVRYGDTMVLATIVAAPPKVDLGYFPLSVDYVERLYAGGRIKGSRWVKREGRPSDDAILKGRLIDRSIRPLFPKGYMQAVQVIVTILSVDGENEPDVVAINAVSAALAISNIPWKGPVGAVRLGYVPPKDGEQGHFLLNPSQSENTFCDLEVVVSTTGKKVPMIEAGAKEVPETIMFEALKTARLEGAKIVDTINELAKEVGIKKEIVESSTENLPEIPPEDLPTITPGETAHDVTPMASVVSSKQEVVRKETPKPQAPTYYPSGQDPYREPIK